jgi:hypothetical protein
LFPTKGTYVELWEVLIDVRRTTRNKNKKRNRRKDNKKMNKKKEESYFEVFTNSYCVCF